jgi:5S rRNA maturation endonuclease (ribonuclease M5)
MKFQIILCDPDGIGDDVQKAIVESMADVQGLTGGEHDALRIARQAEVWDVLGEFIADEDTIVLEIDTVEETARVVLVSDRPR